jgi:D-serine deaminase-like pyridoxal phosphate-dependent protein
MNLPFPLPDDLDTPCVVVDLDVVTRNATRMAEAMAARGVALRPHFKTHKSVRLARLQLDAGARGITAGTLGEAEVLVAAGIEDVFVAYPLWAVGPKAARLRALIEQAPISVGVDSVAGAERLAAAVDGVDRRLRVLIEIDSGLGRTGVPAGKAGPIATAATELGLKVGGVFTHAGQSYGGQDRVQPASRDEVDALESAAASLGGAGIEAQVISAGSTPTALPSATGSVNEMRAGTYLLGDGQQLVLGGTPPDGLAVVVASTVVSTSVAGQVVVDAGAKILTKDQAPYMAGFGELAGYPGSVVERVNDYHGMVRVPPEGPRRPHLGEVVAVVPNHVCPVVNLVDDFVVVRDGALVERWPVDARGMNG